MLNVFPGMVVNVQDIYSNKSKVLCVKEVSVYNAQENVYKLTGVNEVVYIDATSKIEVLAD